MQSVQRIGFHESTVVRVRYERGTVALELEGVRAGEELRTASILLAGVRSILRDGLAVNDLGSECEGSEVLTLEHTEKALHLISEWTNFKIHRSLTHSYKIECDSIEVEIH